MYGVSVIPGCKLAHCIGRQIKQHNCLDAIHADLVFLKQRTAGIVFFSDFRIFQQLMAFFAMLLRQNQKTRKRFFRPCDNTLHDILQVVCSCYGLSCLRQLLHYTGKNLYYHLISFQCFSFLLKLPFRKDTIFRNSRRCYQKRVRRFDRPDSGDLLKDSLDSSQARRTSAQIDRIDLCRVDVLFDDRRHLLDDRLTTGRISLCLA